MNNLKLFLTSIFFIVISNQVWAHAMWIETQTLGKTGHPQEIKIFYGEYSTNEREDIEKWYSDLRDFSLWLTIPGKEKIKIPTVPGTNFYSASFTPDKDGVYFLTVSHEAKELGGTTKYEFSSFAAVAVGKPATLQPATVPIHFNVITTEIKPYKLNDSVKLTVVQNGKALVKKAVSVFSPEGWTKEYTTNEQGEIRFTAPWTGRYVLEVSNFEKVSGDHHGKTFTAYWQGATSSFEVIKQ